MSAPLVAGYAALAPDTVRTLILQGLQGPPIAFDAAARGRMLLRKPVEFPVTTPLRLWDWLDELVVEPSGRKLAWMVGGPDIPGAVYREFVEELLLGDRLLAGDCELNGQTIDLGRIDVPVLLVLGRKEEFVPCEASVPLFDAIAGDDTTTIELPVGHWDSRRRSSLTSRGGLGSVTGSNTGATTRSRDRAIRNSRRRSEL